VSINSGVVGDLASIIISTKDLITPKYFSKFVTDDQTTSSKLLFHNEKTIRDFASTFIHTLLIEAYKKGEPSDK
jgi:hypothetical protein